MVRLPRLGLLLLCQTTWFFSSIVAAKEQCRLQLNGMASHPSMPTGVVPSSPNSTSTSASSSATSATPSRTPFNYGTDIIRGVNLWVSLTLSKDCLCEQIMAAGDGSCLRYVEGIRFQIVNSCPTQPWITPSIFEATNDSTIVDEYTLGLQTTNYNATLAMLQNHWSTVRGVSHETD